MYKIDSLSIIVWVSIPARPKLPSRVYCFGQNSRQKVLPCKMTAVELWPLVWRVKRLNSWFLAILLVETNGLSTFGHSVKWPLVMVIFGVYTIDHIHNPEGHLHLHTTNYVAISFANGNILVRILVFS